MQRALLAWQAQWLRKPRLMGAGIWYGAET